MCCERRRCMDTFHWDHQWGHQRSQMRHTELAVSVWRESSTLWAQTHASYPRLAFVKYQILHWDVSQTHSSFTDVIVSSNRTNRLFTNHSWDRRRGLQKSFDSNTGDWVPRIIDPHSCSCDQWLQVLPSFLKPRTTIKLGPHLVCVDFWDDTLWTRAKSLVSNCC